MEPEALIMTAGVLVIGLLVYLVYALLAVEDFE
ncbi:potassium-transporting ATPase subunit F [Pseudomonas putida]|jgi:K+-transporting ATPase KdpF subunit|nr:potassium-transporting ATPase subunit F [Pseudomonas putida]